MRSRGISRPSRHLKRRLTTQTGEICPRGRSHGRVFDASGPDDRWPRPVMVLLHTLRSGGFGDNVAPISLVRRSCGVMSNNLSG
jgi:hypothetical protein